MTGHHDQRITQAVIVVLLLAAALFRGAALPALPWGLSQDEVLDADLAVKVLEGQHTLFFQEGYGHEPLFHYLAAPSLVLIGENPVGLRFPALACGMLLAATTYVLARRLFGRVAGLSALGGMAVTWWPIIFSRIGIRAISLAWLAALAVYLLARAAGLKSGWHASRRLPWFALAGAVLGSAWYTYTAASVLPLAVLTWLVYLFLFHRRAASQRKMGWLVLVVASLGVVAPMLAYLAVHPAYAERVQQLSEPLQALRAGNPQPVLNGLLASLMMFGGQGDPRYTYNLPGRPVLGWALAAWFYLGVMVSLWRWRQPAYALLVAWFAAGLIPSAVTPDTPSMIRAMVAMPAVFILPGAAVRWALDGIARYRPMGHPMVSQAICATGAAVLILSGVAESWRTIHDQLLIWASDPEVYWRYKAYFADTADAIRRQPGKRWVISEPWYDPIDHDSLRRNLGYTPQDVRWVQAGNALIFPAGQTDTILVRPLYAPLEDELRQELHLYEDLISESRYRMPDGRAAVSFYRLSPAQIEQPLRPARRAESYLPGQPARLDYPIRLGATLDLLGYQVSNAALKAGDELHVLTYWQVETRPPSDLALFLHVLPADADAATAGQPVAQHDGFDAVSDFLMVGDVLVQLHRVALPPDMPPGGYRLQVGAYRRVDGQRFMFLIEGLATADSLWLQTINVLP